MTTIKENLLRKIDGATAPPMTKDAALDLLEELRDGISASIEALREEIKNEAEDDA